MTKEELEELRTINERINSKERQKVELREKMSTVNSSTDYSNERVQTSHCNHAEDKLIKLIDLEIEIDKDIDELVDKRNRARTKINQIKGEAGLVLEMRYLECLDWKDISTELNKSDRSVYRIHLKALEEVQYVN